MQLWATGDWQLYHNTSTDAAHCAEFFGETSSQPDYSAPLQPRSGTLQHLSFPKSKITFERDEISGHGWDLGNYHMAVHGDWERTVCGPKVPTLKGTEVSLSHVQCFLYLLSCSINVCVSYYMAVYILERPPIFPDSHILPSALDSSHSWETSSRWLRNTYTGLTNSICF